MITGAPVQHTDTHSQTHRHTHTCSLCVPLSVPEISRLVTSPTSVGNCCNTSHIKSNGVRFLKFEVVAFCWQRNDIAIAVTWYASYTATKMGPPARPIFRSRISRYSWTYQFNSLWSEKKMSDTLKEKQRKEGSTPVYVQWSKPFSSTFSNVILQKTHKNMLMGTLLVCSRLGKDWSYGK